MTESELSPKQAQTRLQELQEQVRELRREESEVEEQIARLQAELSRSRGRNRQRARVSRSASIPSLQTQRRRLGAEIFRLEQEIRALRERLDQP